MPENMRTITVTTIDGQVYASSAAVERQTGLGDAHGLFHNFKSLAHIHLTLDNGDLVYLNPQHIVSAVINNTQEV